MTKVKGRESQLNALYYPYADITQSQQLLLAAIYFENIYVLEPNFFYPPSVRAFDWVPSSDSMRPLISSKVVRPIGPEILGFNKDFGLEDPLLDEENVAALSGSIRQDLENQDLRELTRGAGFASWNIPTGQQLFWNGLGLLLESTKEPHGSTLEVQTDRSDFYRGILDSGGYHNVPIAERTESRVRTCLGELEVRVPFLEAESLMLNVALLACAEYGLCPITDSSIHHDFLHTKLSNQKNHHLVEECRRSLGLPLKAKEIALRSINLSLPRIQNLNANKVIQIREKCGDSLRRYRIEIGKLRHKLECEPWSDGFEEEVQKTIDVEVLPAIAELEATLLSRQKEFGIKLVEDSAKLAPLPLIASLAIGLPVEWSLFASAGIVALKDYIDYQIKKNEVKNNGLYFLLDAAAQ